MEIISLSFCVVDIITKRTYIPYNIQSLHEVMISDLRHNRRSDEISNEILLEILLEILSSLCSHRCHRWLQSDDRSSNRISTYSHTKVTRWERFVPIGNEWHCHGDQLLVDGSNLHLAQLKSTP
jgi:hypothetical protein